MAAFGTVLALTGVAHGESQLMVRLKPGASPTSVAVTAKVIYRDRTPGAPFALYGVPAGMSKVAAQAALVADPRVVWAEDNLITFMPEHQGGKGGSMAVIGNRTELVRRNTAYLTQINWKSNLAISAGVLSRIAILDTGLSRKQTALWAKADAWMDAFAGTADDIPSGRDTNLNGIKDEGAGHGTMIAGICDMVAPRVRFVIAKVADSDGVATSWTLTKGLAFAATHGAKVANVSLGSINQIVALRDVTDWCDEVGLLYVGAIGNGSAPKALYPSIFSKVICVSALNPNKTKASFSNWDGACDLAAPGVGLVSQYWNGYMGTWSGSSFAAPFVAATAADYLRHRPTTDSRSLMKVLTNNGASIDGLNPLYKSKVGKLLDFSEVIAPVASAAP